MSAIDPDPFELDARLAADSWPVVSLSYSDVRVINDARFLWCLVIPRMAGLRDWTDVPRADKAVFYDEVEQVGAAVRQLSKCDKLNVASLGNVVEQLHVHVIARHRDDPGWPAPVWGLANPVPYTQARLRELTRQLVEVLGDSSA